MENTDITASIFCGQIILRRHVQHCHHPYQYAAGKCGDCKGWRQGDKGCFVEVYKLLARVIPFCQNFSKKISSKKNLILEKKLRFEGGENAVEEQKMGLFSPKT